jgi:hypothetical protein
MRLLIKEKTRFILQPSSEVASQANGLLKSESFTEGSKVPPSTVFEGQQQSPKIDRTFMQRLFGVVVASMIAVSAYAYLV